MDHLARGKRPADQRRTPRVRPASGRPIEVQLEGTDFLDIFRAEDISEGGMKVVVPHLFEGCDVDREIDLIVKLPAIRAFSARGRIRHRRTDAVTTFGVEFTKLSATDRARVAAYVNKRISEGGAA